MSTRLGLRIAVAALTLSVSACGGPSARVFFVQPTDGATIKPETTVQFGSEDITIAAVPEGEVTRARPNTVHYHIGTDTDCLPAGQVIPKESPWVHFGNGKDTADIQLTPGMHKLTVQAGDDQHRTIEGLCETITVNVEP